MLTSRQKQIIGTLLEKSGFVPVSEVAAALQISGRTVMRELGALKYELNAYGAEVERKSSQGVRLVCPEQQRAQLNRDVNARTKLLLCSKEERRQFILSTLLHAAEPVKMLAFTSALGVTDATVSADLDKCDVWLKNNQISLIRKPGVGVYLVADEWHLRRGILNLFHDAASWQEVIAMLNDRDVLNSMAAQDIMGFLDAELLWLVAEQAGNEKRLRDILRADKDYSEFLITVFCMLKRVREGHTVKASGERMAEWAMTAEYPVILSLLGSLARASAIPLNENEADYLMLQLQQSHGRITYPERTDEQTQSLVKEVVRIAESETGYLLEGNTTFYRGLCEHLIPAINRLRLNLEIRNPLLHSVKDHYPHLYALAKTCTEPLGRALQVPVPEEEVAYIAMHLGVALEDKNLKRNRVFRTVVCCPAGMVSAQFLATLLGREFPELLVTDILATTNISTALLMERGADIVISTVPIAGLKTAFLTVSPFLLEDDKERLRAYLKTVSRRQAPWGQNAANMKERLSGVKRLIDGILQILDHFFLIDGPTFTGVRELIAYAAREIGGTEEERARIEQALLEREKYGSTIDYASGCMLLHARTAGVTELRFGILRNAAEEVLSCEGKLLHVSVILVMLAPMQCPSEGIAVMGAISQGILNEEWLPHAFRYGGREDCYAALERLLAAFQSEYFMMTGKEQK
ncbi:MAG TPA: PRD domain-containing protein [Feifaniaceae bacterium]|nr:PRD domain-containing protein [Feifaniaceae bacterium]